MPEQQPGDVRGTTWRGVVTAEGAEERVDRWLADRLDASRNQVQRWIRDGRVEVAGTTAKPSTALGEGDEVVCRVPAPTPDPVVRPEEGDLRVLWEDEHLAVIDKEADLAVHPGAGRRTGTLAHRLVHRYPELATVGGRGRPGIVHRLDLDTTGALVVARTEAAYRGLSEAFAGRGVDKAYLAVVHGRPHPPAGLIDEPIARHPRDRKKMTVRDGGRRALSSYRILATAEAPGRRGPVASVLEVEIETGRTHQIRVHLKHLGTPIVGDPVYGEARWRGVPKRFRKPLSEFHRPALHAWKLGFDHPVTDERIEVEAPIPEDLVGLWRDLGGDDLRIPG